jgi:hypothetical protein
MTSSRETRLTGRFQASPLSRPRDLEMLTNVRVMGLRVYSQHHNHGVPAIPPTPERGDAHATVH